MTIRCINTLRIKNQMATRKKTASPTDPASGTVIAQQNNAVKPTSVPGHFLTDVREILLQARRKAYAATNFIMVEAYWKIGQRIVEEEQQGKDRADYGSYLIRDLARQLGDEFGHGVGIANLKNFRQFYVVFPDFEKSYAARSFLTWSHWRLVMRVASATARDYYIREAADQAWSSRQLERHIATHTFERLLAQPQPAMPGTSTPPSAVNFIKDPYVLEFLGLPENAPSERKLEDNLILRLQDFLMELGKGFSFIGRQFRVSSETSHFYVDLVFYNYLLKCFVLTDLKTKKTQPCRHRANGYVCAPVRRP